MVNVSDYRNVPYLHFQKLRREGTTIWRRGKALFVTALLFIESSQKGKPPPVMMLIIHSVNKVSGIRRIKTDRIFEKTGKTLNKT